MMKKTNIAILLTCYNRKRKTITALTSLFEAIKNGVANREIIICIFLTDDGCTDGTSEAVLCSFPSERITIVKADGNAYWAGGMRLAWNAALKSKEDFDFYLLINDDTQFHSNCLNELFETHKYSKQYYGKGGVYTGFICSTENEYEITYGAKVYSKGFTSKALPLLPTGTPQECSMTNANVLMVANEVVEKIGILDEKYIHAAADMDYGIRAQKAGFPVLTTSNICGYCDFDHDNSDAERGKVMSLDFKARKVFLDRPNVKQYHDGLVFYWRYDKIKYIIFKLSYYLNLYWPSLYYKLFKKRGH